MPSHQDRRTPLDAAYQFPSRGCRHETWRNEMRYVGDNTYETTEWQCGACGYVLPELAMLGARVDWQTRLAGGSGTFKHQWWCGGKEPCACTEQWKRNVWRLTQGFNESDHE